MTPKRSDEHHGPFPWKIHPVWRGIGCILFVIIPVVSIGLAQAVLPLLETPDSGFLAISITLPFVGEVQQVYAQLILAIFFAIVIFLLLSLVGSILYSASGGPSDEEKARFVQRDSFKH
ncbi:MAG: hypothetical protein DWG76_05855 [Chloroflexi bacterium]|nr:hypothetical protein [Chloroflexota bacterium]MQC26955.1 hypothetical protein [Chloroflexota bacterium]